MFSINIESELWGNKEVVTLTVRSNNPELADNYVSVWKQTEHRDEPTTTTDKEDIAELYDEIIEQAIEVWELEGDNLETLKQELLNYN